MIPVPVLCSESLTIIDHHVPFPSTSDMVLLATDPEIAFPSAYGDLLLFIG
jgi:hypothetical protein